MQDPNESFNRVCTTGNTMTEDDKDVNEIGDYQETARDLEECDARED
jgi:hypothetical protein